MITETFTFTYTRLRYLKVAVESIPTFLPDGKTAPAVGEFVTEANARLTAALAQKVKAGRARGALQAMQELAHDSAVMVHASMRSCYRRDQAALDTIRSVPTDDRTAAQTLHRMKELSAVWATLPDLPDTTDAFVAGGITKAMFDQQITDFDTRLTEYSKQNAQLDNEEAKLRALNAKLEDFITAALVQGRAQYPAGTPERALIEAVPVESGTQKPAQARITLAESQAEGAVHLEFDADRATSFQVWHKGPREDQFVPVADSIRPGTYQASGVSAGAHEYRIVGVNSRGEGPSGETTVVTVAASAAAA